MIEEGKYEMVHQYEWMRGKKGVTEGLWREMKAICFILRKLK